MMDFLIPLFLGYRVPFTIISPWTRGGHVFTRRSEVRLAEGDREDRQHDDREEKGEEDGVALPEVGGDLVSDA